MGRVEVDPGKTSHCGTRSTGKPSRVAQDWLLHAGLQSHADRGRENAKTEAKLRLNEAKEEVPQRLAVYTQLEVPLCLLPILRGTIKHYLLGPDSLFPDYLVVVVVGNEKRKMFIFPKQHRT
ncbi:uncharacterized protein ACIB01_015232 [Guaruba guarouba]